MGLMDFIRKQFVDVLEWVEADDKVLIWRFPMAERDIQYGAALTVLEGQLAVLVHEGIVMDVFGPGRHKLSYSTLPVLASAMKWDQQAPISFKSDVYFLSTRLRAGREWKMPLVAAFNNDPGSVQVHAGGRFAWRITDARLFLASLTDKLASVDATEVEHQLCELIVSCLAPEVCKAGDGLIEAGGSQGRLALRAKDLITPCFKCWGLELADFEVTRLSLLDAVSNIKPLEVNPVPACLDGTRSPYPASQAARGHSSGGGAPYALMTEESTAYTAAPQFKLAQLKALLDLGLITAEDYEISKQAVLKQIVG